MKEYITFLKEQTGEYEEMSKSKANDIIYCSVVIFKEKLHEKNTHNLIIYKLWQQSTFWYVLYSSMHRKFIRGGESEHN